MDSTNENHILAPWRPPAVGLAIVAYCAVQADDLLLAWRHSPFDRVSWVAMLVWLAPLWIATRGEFQRGLDNGQKTILTASLFFILLGEMASMNAIKYGALTLAIIGLVPWQPILLVWLAGAFCWMPVFGYFASKFLSYSRTNKLLILGSRLGIALLVIGIIWTYQKKRPSPAK
jgi:hypothetical protein